MTHSKVLLVGGSNSDIEILQSCVSDHRLLHTWNKDEAFALLQSTPDIKLVCIDLHLPEEDPFELLARIRSDERLTRLPVIVLVDPDQPEREIRSLYSGAFDTLHTPLTKLLVKERIRTYLGSSNLSEVSFAKADPIAKILFQQAPIGIAISFRSGPTNEDLSPQFAVNPMFERITGWTREELLRKGWAAITHEDDIAFDLRQYRRMYAGEIDTYQMEKRFVKPDGSIVWVHMVVAPLQVAGETSPRHICIIQDITRRKDAERLLADSERNKSVLLSHLPGMAYRCEYDWDWTMRYVSAGCRDLTGYGAEELLDNKRISYNSLIAPEYREPIRTKWRSVLSHRASFRMDYEIITREGVRKWVMEMGQGVFDAKGEVGSLEGIILDISEQKRYQDELTYRDEHDLLTGLLNRRYLERMLSQGPQDLILVSYNLSQIHRLSMTYGFRYSQNILQKVASALVLHSDESHRLFSTHEYRYVFVLSPPVDHGEVVAFCRDVSMTIGGILAVERIGWGVGVVDLKYEKSIEPSHILQNLLIASEHSLSRFDMDAKVVFYNEQMKASIEMENDIINELTEITRGVKSGRLFMNYQPIFDLKRKRITGFESLARLRTDSHGSISPTEFIRMAEKSKLIIPLGKLIIEKALHFLKRSEISGSNEIMVSINISSIQLLAKDFVNDLETMVERTQVDPRSIMLEITESMIATDFQAINIVLEQIRRLGIKVAIDDFGTGYSTLARERELQVDCLKIDKLFIDNLLFLSPQEAITADIISMAHKLGHCVVAEGVEHRSQWEYLETHDCDMVQGYLISEPVDGDVAFRMLSQNMLHPIEMVSEEPLK